MTIFTCFDLILEVKWFDAVVCRFAADLLFAESLWSWFFILFAFPFLWLRGLSHSIHSFELKLRKIRFTLRISLMRSERRHGGSESLSSSSYFCFICLFEVLFRFRVCSGGQIKKQRFSPGLWLVFVSFMVYPHERKSSTKSKVLESETSQKRTICCEWKSFITT